VLIAYALTIFASAVLLFLIQPMFARTILPMLGGAPAIWNTALVFYQAVLLAGYAYAHASTRWLGVRIQSILHLCLMLLAVVALPIGVPDGWSPPSQANPVLWLLALLTVSVGLPFFAVSATSPLLQRWFAATRHRHSSDPYFLYAASNLGSMLALLVYPAVIEPTMRLPQQSWWWAAGYGTLIIFMATCVLFLWRSMKGSPEQAVPIPRTGEAAGGGQIPGTLSPQPAAHGLTLGLLASYPRLRWVALAFVPSSLMMSATNYVTTDIAAMPLLWVIPLSIYLLTFILVFSRRPLIPHIWMVRAMPFTLLLLVVAIAVRATDPFVVIVPLHLVAFFVITMVCHGELARSRPPAADLTRFYLYLSVGGVLGGIFNALLAPLMFKEIVEYPIVLSLACLLLPWSNSEIWKSRRRLLDVALPALIGLVTIVLIQRAQGINPEPGLLANSVMLGLPAVICATFFRRPLRFALSVVALFGAATFCATGQGKVFYVERSFFGVTKVGRDYTGEYNQLLHGSTLHGRQAVAPALRRIPVGYYQISGPLGQFFAAFNGTESFKNIAVVGLGTGGICSYARAGQHWTYFEIDPVVERVARDSRFFTYLKDCEAEVKIVLGDGRLSLAASPDGIYDLLIMDAYSSDAVPAHLLTREALRVYLAKLAPHGVMVFHITNRYLDLEPVLANLGREAGLYCLTQMDRATIQPGGEIGRMRSQYLVMARAPSDLGPIPTDPRWIPSRTRDDVGLWTDNYSSILKILKWRR
jgi:hypothetical protein